jgi:hypothetical protein
LHHGTKLSESGIRTVREIASTMPEIKKTLARAKDVHLSVFFADKASDDRPMGLH